MDVLREGHLDRLRLLLAEFPVVVLLGARQVGKTTLARQLADSHDGPVTWFDLEDPPDLARLAEPSLELRPLRGLVVLDEIQRLPGLFELLRVLADRPGPPARFLLLGSASPDLAGHASESLAGRAAFQHLDGFGLAEVDDVERLWLRGSFPRSYLARSEAASRRWRDSFVDALLARDLPSLGTLVTTPTLRRFWTMLAHWHGQVWNGAEFGRAFGVSHTTVARYLDLLASVFMVRQIQPWFENIRKRQVRSPKVYVADSGLLHALLGLTTRRDVTGHPKVGASWEGFVVQQIVHLLALRPEQCYHWSTHSGAELDLLALDGARRLGFEVKRTDAPRLTKSMRSAKETLGLDRLDVVHAGTSTYQLADGVHAVPAAELAAWLSRSGRPKQIGRRSEPAITFRPARRAPEPGTARMPAMRYFNTSGPVVEEDHYRIPPLDRVDLAELRLLIQRKRYFVLHAPRQTGKTSVLLGLQDLLNAEGDYRCVYVNIEAGQAMREDVGAATGVMLSQMALQARAGAGDDYLSGAWRDIFAEHVSAAFGEALSRWAGADARPLVLLIDEIDSLVGDTLLSVLRQLRAGCYLRPKGFPQSVILCGVRDVRDYRIYSSPAKEMVSGGSAFNIKAESLRLGDFCQDEMHALLGQHTKETGQSFTDDALEAVWTQTQGQPWLVNALAYETCFRGELAKDHSRPVTEADVLAAREALILRRDTHLDQLTDKLKEDRVRRVIEPLLVGGDGFDATADDIEYVQDLGLIARDAPMRMANPIYAEVVPRQLTWPTQMKLPVDPAWYVDAGGALQLDKLLARFQEFFREHAERWVERFEYKEAGPHLLLQAFLQRIVNSGGRVEREHGLGRGRADLLIEWPEGEATRKYVVECKVRHARRGLERTLAEGVEQTAAYMDRCGAEAGHLVVFDRDEARSWDEKVFRESRVAESGAEIAVWGM